MSMALWMYFWENSDWVTAPSIDPEKIMLGVARFTLIENGKIRFTPDSTRLALFSPLIQEQVKA